MNILKSPFKAWAEPQLQCKAVKCLDCNCSCPADVKYKKQNKTHRIVCSADCKDCNCDCATFKRYT